MPDIDVSSRFDLPAAFDERTTLTQLLRYVRLTVHAKCVGLSQHDADKTPLSRSPAMSITGLQMRAGAGRPLSELLEEYAAQSARTDEVVASQGWEDESFYGYDGGKPVALRYVITHLIEETARHNGHLDILRELADGVTGD